MSEDGRHTWVEHLSEDECWRRLASTPVGRIGIIYDSAPELYPVNYALDGRAIVVRVDPGRVLAGLTRSPAVCFEIDHIDADDESGWSVLVKGRARELVDGPELERAAALPLRGWSLGAKTHWVRIEPEEVTGRRIWHDAG
jgi:nitroimidazol reductase NimA-like FMN-containing flavoprotein (pyridoxamine 5'-phosphate oxidase superfamily)